MGIEIPLVVANKVGHRTPDFLPPRAALPARFKMRSNHLLVLRGEFSVNMRQQLFVGKMGVLVLHKPHRSAARALRARPLAPRNRHRGSVPGKASKAASNIHPHHPESYHRNSPDNGVKLSAPDGMAGALRPPLILNIPQLNALFTLFSG
jgi:hypothetical protein